MMMVKKTSGGNKQPDLSVVVVNRNTRDLLDDCLRSIYRHSGGARLEIVVVDNGSTDGSVEMVRKRFPLVRVICNPTNTGYALANNQGILAASGRYVLLLNSDTVVGESALTALVEFMDRTPDAGACGPLLRYPSGEIQRSCFSRPSPRTYLCRMLLLDSLAPQSRIFGNLERGFDHQRTAPVDALLGAALLVRREVIERVGVLDEQLHLHYNDYDWCNRIRLDGWKIYFVHSAEVVHHSQATTKLENRHLEIQEDLVRNLFDYTRKYFGRSGLLGLRAAMLVGWGARHLTFTVRSLVTGKKSSRITTLMRAGMVRAAVTGNPRQFGGPAGGASPPARRAV